MLLLQGTSILKCITTIKLMLVNGCMKFVYSLSSQRILLFHKRHICRWICFNLIQNVMLALEFGLYNIWVFIHGEFTLFALYGSSLSTYRLRFRVQLPTIQFSSTGWQRTVRSFQYSNKSPLFVTLIHIRWMNGFWECIMHVAETSN